MPTTYAIPNGRTVMDVSLWTGNSVSGTNISGLNFQPDFVWLKSRTSADFHRLQNTNAGINKLLFSNAINAEQTNEANGYVSAVTSNGYTLTSGSSGISGVNSTGNTYVGWSWLASPTTASNTAGTITSTVSANTTAGFSIVTFNSGSSGNKTVGHGLGVAPKFVIVKDRSNSYTWVVYHASVVSNVNQYLELNSTNAVLTYSGIWGSTLPTSSVIGVSSGQTFNANADVVAYCWAPVAGYSAFGSYTGNGSTDGPFIYLGFRPRFIMWKKTNTSTNAPWVIVDTARSSFNLARAYLLPNAADAEASTDLIDILSNGYKWRSTAAGGNANGDTYIYAAFAENPFKYATAR